VLEALLEYERVCNVTPALTAARLRDQIELVAYKRDGDGRWLLETRYPGVMPTEKYLVERRLMRRRSTGQAIEHDRKGGGSWTRFAFPTWWHYDVIRGLEYVRSAGVTPDERLAEATTRVE
jgi:hypothetical protein